MDDSVTNARCEQEWGYLNTNAVVCAIKKMFTVFYCIYFVYTQKGITKASFWERVCVLILTFVLQGKQNDYISVSFT